MVYCNVPERLGPEGYGNLVSADGNRGATAAAGSGLGEVVGVPDHARAAGVAAGRLALGTVVRRLVHGRVPEEDGAGLAHLGDDRRLGREPPAQQDQGALAGVVLVVRVVVVLGQEGNAVHGRADIALGPLRVHGGGDGESIGVDLADGSKYATGC